MIRYLIGWLGTGIIALPWVAGTTVTAGGGTNLWVEPFAVAPWTVRPFIVRPIRVQEGF